MLEPGIYVYCPTYDQPIHIDEYASNVNYVDVFLLDVDRMGCGPHFLFEVENG